MTDIVQTSLTGSYTGETRAFFWLNLKTLLLTILTAGIYRFWARTRIRRYIWSATAPDGEPFEYTGTGLEKLLGFLIAIVVLAVFLGAMQLALAYFGMSVFSDAGSIEERTVQTLLFQATFLVVAPLILIARYRARRYMLSRSRWRGLRFGMEPGAVGYMWRAVWHTALTVLTLGFLLPRQTYFLTKYTTDRTWYGDARFTQGGNWRLLFPAMKHLIAGVLVAALGVVLLMAEIPVLGLGLMVVGFLWGLVGYVSYKVKSYAILVGMTTLAGDIRFYADPSTSTIIRRVVLGGLLIAVILGVLFAIYSSLVSGVVMNDTPIGPVPNFGIAAAVAAFLGLLLVVAAPGVLYMVFIVQPVIREFIATTACRDPAGLASIRQRRGEELVDADGFADALDVGGAI